MTLAIPAADSAQIIDALGRKLHCRESGCRSIPEAWDGLMSRGYGRFIHLGPDIRPPLRLIVWAATRQRPVPEEFRVDSLPPPADWNAAPMPQAELHGPGGVVCRKADMPPGWVRPRTRCEWLVDIVPGDSTQSCRITFTLQKLVPPGAGR
jgi:hypothetical protein